MPLAPHRQVPVVALAEQAVDIISAENGSQSESVVVLRATSSYRSSCHGRDCGTNDIIQARSQDCIQDRRQEIHRLSTLTV